MNVRKGAKSKSGKVLIKTGSSRSSATITVKSDGHTQTFTVPRSPLVAPSSESAQRVAPARPAHGARAFSDDKFRSPMSNGCTLCAHPGPGLTRDCKAN